VRIFYEGTRPYPSVWRVELLQAGFDVPALDPKTPRVPDLAATSSGSMATAAPDGTPFTAALTLHVCPAGDRVAPNRRSDH
jgi:hypothetical protein